MDTVPSQWVIVEDEQVSDDDLDQAAREASTLGLDDAATRGPKLPRLSVKIRDVVCLDVHKWFGGAEVRLDVLVVHGNLSERDAKSAFTPGTFRFPDIHDEQRFPIDEESGLLVFDGKPAFFLDVFIIASRDRKDSDDLAVLMKQGLSSDEVQTATAGLLALATAVPTAAAIAGAIGAAAVLGDLAYQVVKNVSPKTIGMYRGSFLQFRDGFGVGRHPSGTEKVFMDGDWQFWFEIIRNEEERRADPRS